ncbi:MAG: segregation/condensation protein A [Candidatus Omnitrophica bacterium]|nr:segregation/condensation protein A [Candidatus Omnitrophota bacterium]
MKYRIRVPIYEGPLDLLLYLIKKDEIDVCDIPIARITEQYLEYLELMQLLDLEIAGEFLVMAATLMHIKSRSLLPPEALPPEEEEEDPRGDLVSRLLEYQKYKEVAGFLGERETDRLKLFTHRPEAGEVGRETEYIEASIFDLISVFSKVLVKLPDETGQGVPEEEFTIEEKMGAVLEALKVRTQMLFTELLERMRSRNEVIATFLAVLELIRVKEIVVRQLAAFGDIYLVRVEKP